MSINRLLIRIEMPENHWSRELTNKYPNLLIQVEEKMIISDDAGTYRVSIQGPKAPEALEFFEQREEVDLLSIFHESEKNIDVTLLIKNQTVLHRPLMNAMMIQQTPFMIKSGYANWSFACDNEGARRLRSELKKEDLTYKILAYGGKEQERLLTPRQRDIFDAAVWNGYYDKPRKMNLTTLAGELNMSKSSLCERLHIIEEVIMHRFADDIRAASPMG